LKKRVEDPIRNAGQTIRVSISFNFKPN